MFNKEEHIARMKPAVDKLVSYFQKKGVSFSPNDSESLNNVVFTSDKKSIKISHHSFYRYSGIACICKDKGENQSEAIEVTNEMFINNFMKPIIEALLTEIESKTT